MANPWFRYHADVLNHKRIQKLDGDLFKLWVNCQCILAIENVGSSGKLPPIEDCSYFLRMSVQETVRKFEDLVDAGLLLKRKVKQNVTENETKSETKSTVSYHENETLFETDCYDYFLKNWGKKQYKSDSSTERVKRFREKQKSLQETPPDQIRSDNRSDQIREDFFKVEDYLTKKGVDDALRHASGWDIEILFQRYNEQVNSGKFQKPARPNEAFPSWVLSFTKGKPP